MPLERVDVISDLNASYPYASDFRKEGDDHLRNLKKIKDTFPGVAGVVLPTKDELNFVKGVRSAIQDQIDLKAPLASPALTGIPTTPEPSLDDNSTQIATTAFVRMAIISAPAAVITSDIFVEYPSPVITSKIYPAEVIESLDASSAFQGNRVFNQPLDGLNVGASLFAAALLRTIGYQTLTQPADLLDASVTFVAGTLVRVIGYVTQTQPPDEMDASATLVSGTLVRVIGYVTYNTPIDELNASATLVSGTLT